MLQIRMVHGDEVSDASADSPESKGCNKGDLTPC